MVGIRDARPEGSTVTTARSGGPEARPAGWRPAGRRLAMDEVLRASGQYGPHVPVPADADPQTRLIALVGRAP